MFVESSIGGGAKVVVSLDILLDSLSAAKTQDVNDFTLVYSEVKGISKVTNLDPLRSLSYSSTFRQYGYHRKGNEFLLKALGARGDGRRCI